MRIAARLRFLQQGCTALLLTLLAVTCGLYWWTFETQTRWEQDYRQLVALRVQSRQITALSEALTGDLASAVALKVPLRVATPAQSLSLEPAPSRPLLPSPQATSPLDIPVGY